MKQIIISIVFMLLTITLCCGFAFDTNLSIPIERTIVFTDENLENYTMSELQGLINKYAQQQLHAHTLANAARELGWDENSQAIQMAKMEYWNAERAIRVYQKQYDKLNAEWETKRAEYPAATEIWLYMKELGWNDYVCAGILGNMMAEVGGQTLDLQVSLSSNSYYGICQWSKKYYSEINGGSLEEQCDFLKDTIQEEFDTYGYLYTKGFDFESFLKLTDETKTAKSFSVCYERCSSSSHKIRQSNATTAYKYFANGNIV